MCVIKYTRGHICNDMNPWFLSFQNGRVDISMPSGIQGWECLIQPCALFHKNSQSEQ